MTRTPFGPSSARAVPGRALLAGDQGKRLRIRLRPACAQPGKKDLMGGEIGAQTEQVFANLRAILEEAGGSLDRLVKTTVFLRTR